MEINDQLLIFYPFTEHPMLAQRTLLRKKYVALMRHYLEQFRPNDPAAEARLQQLHRLLLDNETVETVDLSEASREIMKTRSTRCLFLFDSIFVLAPTDERLAGNICSFMKAAVNARYHQAMDSMPKKMFALNPVWPGKFVTEEMYDCWVRTQNFLRTPQKTVVLTATMSAGKSSLINTLAGQELSFAKKAACTGTTIEFVSTPAVNPMYHIISERETLFNRAPEDVRAYTDGQTNPCTIIGHFASPLEKYRIRFIDTPGVDSSRNPEHKKITRGLLENSTSDVLLYVIPAACYGSEDDYDHLSYVQRKAKYRKVIFVLNMMDECDPEDDSIDEIVSNVREHLEDIGFSSPVICPISAKAGFLLKAALHGKELTEHGRKAVQAFHDKFNDAYYEALAYQERASDMAFAKSEQVICGIERGELLKSYVNTGIPHLESVILNTLKEV